MLAQVFLFSHMRKWRPSQTDPTSTLDEKKFPLKKKWARFEFTV